MLFFVLIWELTVRSGMVSRLILPSSLDILKAFAADLVQGTLLVRIGISLAMVLAGLMIGCVIASILAVAAYYSPFLAGGIDTMTAIAHPLPGIALLPLVILWFGTGTLSVICIIVHSVTWPMVINMRSGFRAVHRNYIDVGQNYGFGRWGIMRYIIMPGSWSYIFAGIRIAWARSWRAVISAEMVFGVIGVYGGLGWYIFNKRVFMDTPGMYAGILVLIIIGLLIEDGFFEIVERRSRHLNRVRA